MNTMENLKEVRRQNLNLVLTSLGGHGAQKKLSEKSGIYYTYISNLRQGHKEMGEEIARKIEAAMSLSSGWMDQAHSSGGDGSAVIGAVGAITRRATLDRVGNDGGYDRGSTGAVGSVSADSVAVAMTVYCGAMQGAGCPLRSTG